MFRDMRRKDRKLKTDEAWEILNTNQHGVLSVITPEGYPYGVPMHYVMVNNKIYMHGTNDGGLKSDSILQNNKVSFTVIEHLEGMRNRSAIAFGTVRNASELTEMAMEKIIEKFIPSVAWDDVKTGIPYAKNNLTVYEITIEQLTAKVIDKPER